MPGTVELSPERREKRTNKMPPQKAIFLSVGVFLGKDRQGKIHSSRAAQQGPVRPWDMPTRSEQQVWFLLWRQAPSSQRMSVSA